MDVEKRADERRTESGIEVKPLYKPEDLEGFDYAERLGDPGEYPYTRGVYPTMYRGRPWTMRQYAGFGTARETNRRFKYLSSDSDAKRLPEYDGNYPVIGSWLVDGYACGIGIREDRGPITTNTSRFVPHLFVP